jgi:hypothetical protein
MVLDATSGERLFGVQVETDGAAITLADIRL